MTNRELQDTLAMLELVSSILAIQLLLQSRLQDNDNNALVIDNNRGQDEVALRLAGLEERLCRLEEWVRKEGGDL